MHEGSLTRIMGLNTGKRVGKKQNKGFLTEPVKNKSKKQNTSYILYEESEATQSCVLCQCFDNVLMAL